MEIHKPDSYKSLATQGISDELVISKSKFTGYAKMTASENEALKFIDEIKSEHPDASCICYGYQCGYTNQVQRYHDGHEPVGGMPILEAIRLNDLINTTCVVVRYFGGTKLGVGGLARAFSNAAAGAIKNAEPSLFELGHEYELIYDYHYNDKILYLIQNSSVTVISTDYLDKISLRIQLKDKYKSDFFNQINAITNNKHKVEVTKELYTS